MLQQTEAKRMPVDPGFIGTVLRPYAKKQCIYLKSAATTPAGFGASIQATFSIEESCYIDATGHFNAVELNLCYNQLFYLLFADGMRRGGVPCMEDWDVARFLKYQLTAMFITRLHSRFRRPIDGRNFTAEGYIHRIQQEPGRPIFVQTSAVFRDGKGGAAEGEVEFAVVGGSA